MAYGQKSTEGRWENGYYVYSDTECVAWLKQFHPESNFSLSSVFSSVSSPLQSTEKMLCLNVMHAWSSSYLEFILPVGYINAYCLISGYFLCDVLL